MVVIKYIFYFTSSWRLLLFYLNLQRKHVMYNVWCTMSALGRKLATFSIYSTVWPRWFSI